MHLFNVIRYCRHTLYLEQCSNYKDTSKDSYSFNYRSNSRREFYGGFCIHISVANLEKSLWSIGMVRQQDRPLRFLMVRTSNDLTPSFTSLYRDIKDPI
ncbi:hypothetical protein NPIL_437021 [Nephila pilipes]|uniref:Uncharacterized protein n=1 Tax=Nephila pilipes TaxID=299642 RepID=A0A8X6QYJ4_NEPPI|nr:hypothetical protein NPIL_437021 [Nephila pilipes]